MASCYRYRPASAARANMVRTAAWSSELASWTSATQGASRASRPGSGAEKRQPWRGTAGARPRSATAAHAAKLDVVSSGSTQDPGAARERGPAGTETNRRKTADPAGTETNRRKTADGLRFKRNSRQRRGSEPENKAPTPGAPANRRACAGVGRMSSLNSPHLPRVARPARG